VHPTSVTAGGGETAGGEVGDEVGAAALHTGFAMTPFEVALKYVHTGVMRFCSAVRSSLEQVELAKQGVRINPIAPVAAQWQATSS